MASLHPDNDDITVSSQRSDTQSPVKSKAIGAIIDGHHTDIIISEFQDRLFVVLSQYKKLGALVSVSKEAAQSDDMCYVYNVRTLLGQENLSHDVAARYIAEQTHMVKPVLFSICLKDNSFKTVEALKDIILQNKSW